MIMVDSNHPEDFEKLIRPLTNPNVMGDSLSLAVFPMSGSQWNKAAIQNTVTFAIKVGESLNNKEIPIGFERIAKGFLTELQLSEKTGFDFGYFRLQDGDTIYTIYEQNESLMLFGSNSTSMIAKAPNSICCIDENFHSVTNAELVTHSFYEFYTWGNEYYTSNEKILEKYRNFFLKMGYAGK
jgi:DUF917 family protein